ncbi:MAG: efflux RND transporter permease subunit [Candidatus Omnitrophica bacterium]|nr:efflux RND transporter permease subunit [Candidatus Omnitrophota bacterium]
MFDKLILWSLKNRLLVVVGLVVFLVISTFTTMHMPVDVFPEFAPPQVVVQTESPGLAPEDVESLITFPVESAVNGTPGVDKVRSQSSVGLSTVIIVFGWGTDVYVARQLVNERIQSVRDRFPAGTQAPVMLPITSAVGWMIKYSLESDTRSLMDLRTISDWQIRPRILALGGVASVVSIGGEVKQYQVLLDPDRMSAYHVSVAEVQEALAKANVNVPGAFLQSPGQEYIVTGTARIQSLDDLRDTIIKYEKGTPIFVRNVAEVKFGPQLKRGDGALNLKNAVIGTISKAYGADTLATTYKAEAALRDIQKQLPPDVKLNMQVFRQADFIEGSIRNLNRALLEGGIIVTLILFIFLMNIRASFISFISMPASLLAGVMVLKWFGVSLNSMTIGGLAIAIGEVVDNAIIGVENCFRRLRLNRESSAPRPSFDIVFEATSEIMNSVVYATCIVAIVFLPIFFLPGLEGRIFAPLGITYLGALICSLVVAVTVTPALCYLLIGNTKKELRESFVAHWLKKYYERLLHFTLRHVWPIVITALVLVGVVMALIPFLGRSFMPEFHEGNFIVVQSTLPGTSLDESMRLGLLVRQKLLKYPQVVLISQRAGRSELDEDAQPPNFSEFDVKLDYDRDRNMPPEELLRRIRADLSKIPGAVYNIGQFISHRFDEVLSGVRAQVAIKIYGDDLAKLRQIGWQVQQILQTVKGVEDLALEQQINVPQLIIRVNREKASRYGIKTGELAETVETLLNGITVSQVLEGQKSFDLYLRLQDSARNDANSIRNILVDAPALAKSGDVKVPLRQVARVEFEQKPYFINREDVQRRIVVSCNVAGRDLNSLIVEAQKKINEQVTPKLPGGYFIQYGGQFESQQEAQRILMLFGIGAVVGIFLMLYQAFGTTREALLVMLNLPLALIGGVIAVFLAGRDLSVPAMIGFISLFGIASRNGVILVSHYNQLRKEGKSLRETVVEGSLDRLNPVLMTAATAALGLVPLLWGDPTGKELERPLAHVILGGLFTSTFLNMVVIPTLYNKIEEIRQKRTQNKTNPPKEN